MHLSLLLMVAVPVLGQTIYSWEDKDGIHYTDDMTQVPKKGRVDVQSLSSTSRPMPQRPSERAPVAVAPPPNDAPSAAGRDERGSAEEQWREREWRERFIAAHRRIGTLRQEVAALASTLPAPTRCVTELVTPAPGTGANRQPQSPAQPATRCEPNHLYERMLAQIEAKKVELHDAELDLEQLDRQASHDSIPREWRRGW